MIDKTDKEKQPRKPPATIEEARSLAFLGLIAGAVIGVSGGVVLLAFFAGIPALLLLLIVGSVRGVWLTVTRYNALLGAVSFACALCVAQWPFTWWLLPKIFERAGPSSVGSLPLIALIGFAVAPSAIAYVRGRALISETKSD